MQKKSNYMANTRGNVFHQSKTTINRLEYNAITKYFGIFDSDSPSSSKNSVKSSRAPVHSAAMNKCAALSKTLVCE